MTHRPFFSIAPVRPLYPEPEPGACSAQRFLVVRGNNVLLVPGTPAPAVVLEKNLPAGSVTGPDQYLGRQEGTCYYASEAAPDAELPEGAVFVSPRELFGRIPDPDVALAAYATRMIDYDRSTRFCGRCGAKTRPLRTERARLCTDCNRIVYPRISPAIIVLIKKGDEVLLASSPRFPKDLHSVLAGFVEPGENLEETVHREVREEVGIEITNIRYFGSEPWPFPDSLMIGFVADYAGGEIHVDPGEIRSAGWFSRDNLPLLPTGMSISRALIDAWLRHEI
ncbi:MAG: NAD(+) diphosphatase [Methanomicrobiales archaeon]|nr:NAD(+) diphosphatase [Methanomicrobiales archaeon]